LTRDNGTAGRPALNELNALRGDCAIAWLGIEFIDVGETTLQARMPVERRTQQPFGALHIVSTTQVWQVDIADEAGRLCCVSRMTLAIAAGR
jgi:acyl-coenzyme A thioesterase PaaI-like protein